MLMGFLFLISVVTESGLQTATGITPDFFQEGYEWSLKANDGEARFICR